METSNTYIVLKHFKLNLLKDYDYDYSIVFSRLSKKEEVINCISIESFSTITKLFKYVLRDLYNRNFFKLRLIIINLLYFI